MVTTRCVNESIRVMSRLIALTFLAFIVENKPRMIELVTIFLFALTIFALTIAKNQQTKATKEETTP